LFINNVSIIRLPAESLAKVSPSINPAFADISPSSRFRDGRASNRSVQSGERKLICGWFCRLQIAAEDLREGLARCHLLGAWGGAAG
jgi:hypothetical protein